jgi:hypothetical protein
MAPAALRKASGKAQGWGGRFKQMPVASSTFGGYTVQAANSATAALVKSIVSKLQHGPPDQPY